MSEKKPQRLVEVTLAKPHIHQNRQKNVGDKIQVTEPVRDWLVANQVVAAPASAASLAERKEPSK